MKYLLYLKYLVRHKYFVGRECFKLGLYWQGIIHDWHKFLPSEFFPYCEFFYGKFEFQPSWLGYSYNQQEQDYKETTKRKFDIAWLLHQHRAKHHFQHWILRLDSGETKALEMPEKYIKEMYCDYIGAGLSINGKNDVIYYYEKMKDKIILHPSSRDFFEELVYGNLYKK